MVSFQFPMRLTVIVVLLVQLAGVTNLRANERIPYISPGIKIGWDSNRGFTIGPKLSIGLAAPNGASFINLTLSIKSFEKTAVASNQFVYLDVQLGSTFQGQAGVLFGGGAGLLFGKEEGEYKIMPRTTIFFGFIAFLTLDFNFWSEEKISHEAGLEIVLPIPLKKVDFGLE